MTVCACVRLRQCCGHLHLLEKGMISSDSGMEDIGLEDIGLQCHGSDDFIRVKPYRTSGQ